MLRRPCQNLLAKAPDANAPAMLGARCLPLVEALSTRKWTDEEISEDVAAVQEVLAEKLKGMRCVVCTCSACPYRSSALVQLVR